MRIGTPARARPWLPFLSRLLRRPRPGRLEAVLVPLSAVATTGGEVVVFWSAPGAAHVVLEPGGAVPASGWGRLALPEGRHRLVLRATRGAEVAEATASVLVLASPGVVEGGVRVPRWPRLTPPAGPRLPRAPRSPALPPVLADANVASPPLPAVLAGGGPPAPRYRLAALTD